MEKLTLTDLTKTYNPGRSYASLVELHFDEIAQARANRWEWSTIAESLGLDPKRGNTLRFAFCREKKRRDDGDSEAA